MQGRIIGQLLAHTQAMSELWYAHRLVRTGAIDNSKQPPWSQDGTKATAKQFFACDGAVSQAPFLGGCFQNALFYTALGLHAQHQNLHQGLTISANASMLKSCVQVCAVTKTAVQRSAYTCDCSSPFSKCTVGQYCSEPARHQQSLCDVAPIVHAVQTIMSATNEALQQQVVT